MCPQFRVFRVFGTEQPLSRIYWTRYTLTFNARFWPLDAEYENVQPSIQLAASNAFYARTVAENVNAEKGVLMKRSVLHRFDVLGGANHFMILAPCERTPGNFTMTCDCLPSRPSTYPWSPLFHCEPIKKIDGPRAK